MSSVPVLKKVRARLDQLDIPAIFSSSRKTSPLSSLSSALFGTSTVGISNDILGRKNDRQSQDNLLSTQLTLSETQSTALINSHLSPFDPSESSPYLSSNPEPEMFDEFKKLDVAWNEMHRALRLLYINADVFPPLKSAVGGLVTLLDGEETIKENSEEYAKFAIELASTAETLARDVSALAAEGVSVSVEHIVELINMESENVRRLQDRKKIMQTVTANQGQANVIQLYRRIETLFHQLQNEITLRTGDSVRKITETGLLREMSPVYDALYNSGYSTDIHRHGCTADTRQKILEDLRIWAGDPRGAKIYWLNGLVGTGKTTISYTLCEWLKKNNRLGANFFCSRASVLCNNVNRIVPTLAYQLADYSLSFRSMLCNILDEEPGAHKLDVQLQFQKLIQRPLEAVKVAMPDDVIVVIDGLDECEDGDAFRLFLDTLLKFAIDLPIKFFITSRPEPVIRGKMLASAYSDSVLCLHDIEESVQMKTDIIKYLTEALVSMSPESLSSFRLTGSGFTG